MESSSITRSQVMIESCTTHPAQLQYFQNHVIPWYWTHCSSPNRSVAHFSPKKTRRVAVIPLLSDGPTLQIHMKTARFIVFAILLLLSLLSISKASEEDEHHGEKHEEEHNRLETSAIWGYSFLFNFISCLMSAFAIVVCLWAKVTIADKIITGLMAFASVRRKCKALLSHSPRAPK
jgi:hypothetical protein